MPGGIHPPLSVVLSWPKPNYVDPPTASHSTAIVLAILGILSVLFVGTRMVVRFFIQRNAGLDDYFMLAALIPTYGLAVCAAYATEVLQYNRHIWDVKLDMIIKERKMNMAIAVLYIYGATLIKLSVLTFDRRLGGTTKITPKFIYAVRISIALVLLYTIIWTILAFRECTPFSAYWNQFNPKWVAQGHQYTCLNEGANTLANTVVSTLLDFVAFLLPLSLLWRLQISKRQKMALGGVFGVGLLVCVVGIVRIVYIVRLYFLTYDVTWEAYHVYGATAFELLLATICASAPALKIFFRSLTGRESSDNSRNTPATPNKGRSWRARSREPGGRVGGDGAADYEVRMDELVGVTNDKNGAMVSQHEPERDGYADADTDAVDEMKRFSSSNFTSAPESPFSHYEHESDYIGGGGGAGRGGSVGGSEGTNRSGASEKRSGHSATGSHDPLRG